MNEALKAGYVELWRGEHGPQSNLPNHNVTEHSPDGIEWGYGGSGPAELSGRILKAAGVPTDAPNFRDLCLELKNKLVARCPRNPSYDWVTVWTFPTFVGPYEWEITTHDFKGRQSWMRRGRIYIPIDSVKQWRKEYEATL